MERTGWIDTLKGLAILGIIFCHSGVGNNIGFLEPLSLIGSNCVNLFFYYFCIFGMFIMGEGG